MALLHFSSHQAAAILTRCLPALSSSYLLPKRSYRPEVLQRAKERIRQDKKPLHRVIEEMLDLEPVIKRPQSERIPDSHPQYTTRVPMDPTNPHYHEKPAYIFNHDVQLGEGIQQALWLTKSQLVGDGQMPSQVQELASSLEIPDMENKVEQSIKQCRLYDTPSSMLSMDRFSFRQTKALTRLGSLLGKDYPELLNRAQANNYYVGASWTRDNDAVQVRGRPGMILTSKNPLPVLASQDEINQTVDVPLESFYPLAPTIDLRSSIIYKENYNFPGFFDGYPFPHAHTLFVFATYFKNSESYKAKGIMFAFANALCRAKQQYGVEEVDLPTPIVTQCIVTNGVKFSFIHVQLNTLRLDSSDGPKNMVWLDAENPLYLDMYPQNIKIYRTKGNRKTDKRYWKPLVKRDPELGCRELDIGVFKKFLGCYLNGAVH
ncbi:large ribosomal subunit protein mL37-like [Asterias amurensis]|uniref:large ribosomal subunit protein mL37-like n=1 Tax=Asterias amurensis TaxID=7602 RepID=UPI003AB37AFD